VAVYLLCILAPGAALAFGSGPVPCFTDELLPAAIVSVHDDPGPMTHADGSLHDHSGMHGHHQTDAGGAPASHHHDGKTLPGPCCAMLCMTALPADLPTVIKPSQPVSICLSETYQSIEGRAPPLLYRPPIA
jgi:hypothetical protein